MPKKMSKKGSPEVHKDLKGFEISVNEFGEIEGKYEFNKLKDFLDDHVDDKKLMEMKEKFGLQLDEEE